MSERQIPLPTIRKITRQENGTLKIRLTLPSEIPEIESHDLTVFAPITGSGIGEPSKIALSNALEQLQRDITLAVMGLRNRY